MSWLTNVVLPKIRAVVARKAVPDNLWHKCPACEQMLLHRELEANLHVCRNCGHHLRIGAARRLKILFDDGASTPIDLPKTVVDPLRFRDRKRYPDRLKEEQATFGPRSDTVVVAHGRSGGVPAGAPSGPTPPPVRLRRCGEPGCCGSAGAVPVTR